MKKMLAVALVMSMLTSVSWAAQNAKPVGQKAKNSYALGYQFGRNLKKQEVVVDEDVLLAAIRAALEGKPSAMKDEEIEETLAKLRQQVVARQNVRLKELAAKSLEEGMAFLKANRGKEGVKVLPSGLQYKVLTPGSGPSPKATDTVRVNYRGTLVDGTMFDSSYSRGEPVNIPVQGVIPGWTEALQLMKTGAKWRIFVPPKLAYKDRAYGRIPPNSTLIFDLELLSIKDKSAPNASQSSQSDDRGK